MKRAGFLVPMFVAAVQVGSVVHAAVKVDLNQSTDRKDVLTPGWENWGVKDGPEASAKFDTVGVKLRKAGDVGTGLSVGWWKGGLDYGLTMASDGVYVKDGNNGGQIEMV